MKKGTKAGLISLIAGAAGVGGLAAMGSRLYETTVISKARNTPRDADPDDPLFLGRQWLEEYKGRRDVLITSVDGLRLHADALRQRDPQCHLWAVCIHGYAENARSMGLYVRHYFEAGWNVVAPDLRGHGSSEGNYVGFGWDDRLDIVAWISRIMRRDPDAQIVLHGVSMGAATALMTTGGALPPNVKAVVSDCSYTSALDIMCYRFERSGGKGPVGPVLSALRTTVKHRAHYDLKHADALNAVRRSKTPTLFIHGVNDSYVPATMMADLYEGAKCPKEFLWVPRAAHARSVVVDPELYWATVDDFLRRALAGET